MAATGTHFLCYSPTFTKTLNHSLNQNPFFKIPTLSLKTTQKLSLSLKAVLCQNPKPNTSFRRCFTKSSDGFFTVRALRSRKSWTLLRRGHSISRFSTVSAGEERNGGGGDGNQGIGGGHIGRMAENLLPYNSQISAIVQSFKITGLSDRARILRVASLGFTSVAIFCLSDSIRKSSTNPRLARILSWIGSVATFLGFISMIAMALSASFIP